MQERLTVLLSSKQNNYLTKGITMASKNKTRFNAIDLLILILFIGCIAGFIVRYQVVDIVKSTNNQENASVSFYINDIKETSEAFFAEGDKFFIVGSGDYLGLLEGGFVFEPAEEFNETSDGRYVKSASKSGRSDMRGSFLSNGTFSNEGFLLNNTKYIAPGSTLSIQSGKILVNVIVTDVSRAE